MLDGVIDDWSAMELFWERCLFDYLHVEPEEHQFLMVRALVNMLYAMHDIIICTDNCLRMIAHNALLCTLPDRANGEPAGKTLGMRFCCWLTG
jgi:hypothetical protein